MLNIYNFKGLFRAGLLLLTIVLYCSGALAVASSMNTYVDLAAGANPEAYTINFTAFYDTGSDGTPDDVKIQTEDSWADLNNDSGYVSSWGMARVSPAQLAVAPDNKAYSIWLAYEGPSGKQWGTASGAIPSSGTGYTTPGNTSLNPLLLAAASYLDKPTGVTAAAGDGQISISWSPVAGAAGYRLYARPPAPEPASVIVFDRVGIVANGSAANTVISGLNNGTTYYVIMVANDAIKRSGHTDEITIIPTSAGVPTISGPSSGNAGDSITITGTGFGAAQGSGNVYFSGIPVSSIASWSDASITATIAAGTPAGGGSLVVVTGASLMASAGFIVSGGADTTGPTMTFNPVNGAIGVATTQNVVITFNEPVNTGSLAYNINPDPGGLSVAWSGGNTIATISHTAFANSTAYTVTVTAVTDVAGNSYTGANSSAFTTAATGGSAPAITQLELTSAPGVAITSANIGDGISIIGTNFGAAQGTSTITINGTAVTNFWYWSDTKIDIQVPTGATSGNVIVTVGGAPSNGSSLSIGGVPAALSITTSTLPSGTVGTAYNQTLAASNGTTPYTWAVSAGTLPAGLSLSTAGVLSGTPTGTGTVNFTAQVTDNVAATDTQDLSITINAVGGGSAPTISAVSPSTAAIGQTIVISGVNFGASKSVSTVTVGGIAAKPTAWSNTSVTLAVPTGVASGAATVLMTVAGQSGSSTMTIDATSIYLDDFEGGSVGNWLDPNTSSGYYAFDNGVTPDNSTINAQGLSGEAAYGGTGRGMRIKYSYTTGWGGGWGAILANTLDLSSASQIGFNVRWDGSTNNIKLALKDVDGTSYAATISASTLALVSGYGQVTVAPSSFSYDAAGSSTGADTTFSWNAVASYNFIYTTAGTTTNYQYIDNLVGMITTGPSSEPTGEAPYIASVTPAASPAGARFTVSGARFGSSEGESILLFENTTTGKSYFADITSWSETTIEAIVPAGAATGIYKMKVVRKSIALGIVRALESNEAGYSVTIAAVAGLANAWPNPFNAGSESINISIPSAGGAANIGWYIYDMTAKLAYKTAGSATQISWSGRDINANLPVADGAYILRVVNEDTKTLLAKGKILVVKR